MEKQSNQQANRRANRKSTRGGTSRSPLSTFYQVERVFEAHLRAARSGERPVSPRVGQGKDIVTTILISHLYSEGDNRFSCEIVVHNFSVRCSVSYRCNVQSLQKSSFFSGSSLHVFSDILL